MMIDHVTHFRELDIKTRSPAMKLRSSAEGRDKCWIGTHWRTVPLSVGFACHIGSADL